MTEANMRFVTKNISKRVTRSGFQMNQNLLLLTGALLDLLPHKIGKQMSTIL